MPGLADGFITRPETAPGLAAALVPGATVVLVSPGAAERAGSCGKTQLAVYFAEALWRAGRVEVLAWVDASSRAAALSGYAEAAVAAGTGTAGTAEQTGARLAAWLAATARTWLVVLDDLRDAADLDGLWPAGPAGTVLITTRDQDTVAGQPQAQVVTVGAFSTREAMNYLAGRLADDPDQRQGAIDLAAALGGDPCALAHASALITTTTQDCRHYQHHYTGSRARHPGGEPVTPAAVTWMLSAERAGQLSPGGATWLVLALAALLDGQPIPGPVFTATVTCKYLAEAGAVATGSEPAWDAVRALEHVGLLTIDTVTTPPTVRISRVAAAQARAGMPAQMLERAAQAAADALLEAWPEHEGQPWLAAGLRSCAAALQHTAADRLWAAGACHPLLVKAGHSLDTARLTGPAARYRAQLATTSDRLLGPDHPATLTTRSYLARALEAAGQAAEAAGCWQRVTAARARISGADHPGTLAARVSLGHAIAAAGQPGTAVTVLEEAVAGYDRVRGPGHPDTLSARDELAAACQAVGQPAEAIAHYRRVLSGRERTHGPLHPATMTARQKLAAACLADGRLKEAISCYKKTLADRQRVLGADHPGAIAARRDLAAAYQAAGKIAAALHLHEQVCTGSEQTLGTDHPDTLARRTDLASAYHAAGRLTDAATLLRDTLARCEQTQPPGDPLTQTVRQALTSIAGG
ncbi:MAG TPA: tetratricopeptide repeat protein [Streptosporangiaceae bacterium]|nr:tetratricopeptide repeat protein [Streptosporangiaceae bacterium]